MTLETGSRKNRPNVTIERQRLFRILSRRPTARPEKAKQQAEKNARVAPGTPHFAEAVETHDTSESPFQHVVLCLWERPGEESRFGHRSYPFPHGRFPVYR